MANTNSSRRRLSSIQPRSIQTTSARNSRKLNSSPATRKVAVSQQEAREAGLRYVSDEGPGITRSRRGRGFFYRDSHGIAVTDNATLTRIRSLAIPPAWERVWICADAKGHLQAVGRDAKGRKQYRYHPCYRAVRDLAKFNHLLSFGACLPEIRSALDKDVDAKEMSKRKMLAVVVKLLDETCVRVGNKEYARDNDSYGLTTLKDEHVQINGAAIRFKFRGKSKVCHEFSLSNPKLAKIIKQSQDLPGEELFQYQDADGEFKPLDSGDVNEYIREISGQDFTAKDFRTWHGTVHTLMELANAGPAPSATEAKKTLVSAVKSTASKLGNRPATCRSYYVHPAVIEGYTDMALFRAIGKSAEPPKNLQVCEKVTLILVKQFYETQQAA